jgi:hypothetical protein
MSDELNFSIETTTMRLKSLKLRRTEAADKALDDHLRKDRPAPAPLPASQGPAGRVRHDERGMAVWDWAAAAGDTAQLSATNVMRKLDVSALSIEQTQRELKAMEPAAPKPAGGGDPYNQSRNPASGDPFKRNTAAGSDPYNRTQFQASQSRRPPPAPATKPAAKPGNTVLDQLLGKKK